MVVTFPVHPRRVLRAEYQPQLLTTRSEKEQLLQTTGIDRLVWMDFSQELSMLSAREFMQLLQQKYNVYELVVGYDHRFGHNRAEGFADYVRYGQQMGIGVTQARQLPGGLSSTAVRRALANGQIRLANEALGYPYFLEGQVIHGFHNGTLLGFPTANLLLPDDKFVPMNGAYCVRAESATGHTLFGMLNIGQRPTLDNGSERSIEVHLFDFHDDLYGRMLKVELVDFLRPEQKFDSTSELHRQLERDEAKCRTLITS